MTPDATMDPAVRRVLLMTHPAESPENPPEPSPAEQRLFLDQITTNLERLRGGGGGFGSEQENQRRSVLLALAQNNCGRIYRF